MIQSLKKSYLTKSILLACLLWVIAGVLCYCNLGNLKIACSKPVDFDSLHAEDIKKGVKVKANLIYFYDYFSSYVDDGDTTSMQFLISVGDTDYMAIDCSGKDMKNAKSNMELYWSYLEGEDVSEDDFKTVTVTGTIMPLTGEYLQFYQEYIDELDWTEQEKQVFLPYIIKVGDIGNTSSFGFYFMIVLFFGIIIWGIFVLIGGIKGKNVKDIENYCREQGNYEMALQKVEQFYQMGTPVQGIRANNEFFLAVRGTTVYFMDAKDPLWVYQHVIQHRTNFIPTGKSYYLVVQTANGREYKIPMKNQNATLEAMDYVARSMPFLYFGYSDEIKQFYQRSRGEMARMVMEKRQQVMAQQYNNGYRS